MNKLDLCKALVLESALADSGPATTENQIGDFKRVVGWIDAAWLLVQSKLDQANFTWAEGTLTLPISTSEISYPSTLKSLNTGQVYDTTNSKFVRFMPYETFRDTYRTVSDGTPTIFTVTPLNQIKFNKLAEAETAYTYEGWGAATTMDSDDSVPELPEKFHQLIMWEALKMYSGYDDAPTKFQQASVQTRMLWPALRDEVEPAATFGGGLF